MAAQRQELLHLIELCGLNRRDRVFLTVELARAQCLEELREGQGRGVDAERLESHQQDLRLRHPHLEALEIVRRDDRPLGICDVAKAVLAPAKEHEVLGGEASAKTL